MKFNCSPKKPPFRSILQHKKYGRGNHLASILFAGQKEPSMKRPGFNRVWLPDCWWFRNPKANHRFGCIKPVVNNGINDRSLHWWVKTGFQPTINERLTTRRCKNPVPLSWAFFEPRTSLVTRKTQKERGQVENGNVSRRTFGCSKILWHWNLDGQWDLWSLKIKMNWKHLYVGSVFLTNLKGA